MVLVPMRYKDGIDMMHIVSNERGNHPVVEPAIHEHHSRALPNQDRIGLTNIEDRHRRRRKSIPVDVRNPRQKRQADKPSSHRPHLRARPPDQENQQRQWHHVNPDRIRRHAHGCTRHGGKQLLKEQCAPGGNHGYDERPSLKRRHERKGNQHNRHSEQYTHHRTDDRICQRSNERERTEGGNGDGERRQLRAQCDRKHAGNARRHAQLSQSVGGVRAKAQDGKDAGT